MKKALLFLLLFPCLSVWAFDFGLVLDQSGGYGGFGGEGRADYKAALVPRFSAMFGESGILYLSAGMNVEYLYENWSFIPELLRSEFSWRFPRSEFTIGRMYYSDPLGFIAEGLFDGGRFTIDSGFGNISLGGWYTGFLYKNRANIAMTDEEFVSLGTVVDFDDFANTYFAPSRFFAALDWVHPSIGIGLLRARLSLLGQFDLSGEELHTQYITTKLSLPVNAFLFNFGASLGFTGLIDGDPELFLAAELGADWILQLAFQSRLSFLARYTSGASGSLGAFLPLTTINQGYVLQEKPSGLTILSLSYIARLYRNASVSLSSSYFIRNGTETFVRYPVSEQTENGYLLGNEFFGRLFYSPFSDLSINLGAGVFLPSMGNVTPDHHNRWRIEFGIILSLY